MDMELTDNQKRGLYFLEKAIKRVFPFIRSLDYTNTDFEEYNIYVNIEVDFIKFLKFENLPMNQFHDKYGLKKSVNFFEGYFMSYLFPLVGDDLMDDFSYKYNEKISETLSNIYKSMPPELTLKNEYVSQFSGDEVSFVKDVRIDQYTVYIDPKDIEEDERKRGNI